LVKYVGIVKVELTDDETVATPVWEEIKTVEGIRFGERFEVYRHFPSGSVLRDTLYTGKHYWEIELKCEDKPEALLPYLGAPRTRIGKGTGTTFRATLKDEAGNDVVIYFKKVYVLDHSFEKREAPNIGTWVFKLEASEKTDSFSSE